MIFFIRKGHSLWYYVLNQRCRKVEREAKKRRHKREASGEFTNWGTGDTVIVVSEEGVSNTTAPVHRSAILELKSQSVSSDLQQVTITIHNCADLMAVTQT